MPGARAAVITVSDKASRGEREDKSGPALLLSLCQLGVDVVRKEVVPDEKERLEALLRELADSGEVDLILTTGGTGPAPRDWTPEATRAVIEREMPGLAELIRAHGSRYTPLSYLSRGIAGIRGRCLIINLPGSPRAVQEGMEALAPVLSHALQMLKGENLEHGHTSDRP
jgi:molybdenum cofactor synthesis domain-containing protein